MNMNLNGTMLIGVIVVLFLACVCLARETVIAVSGVSKATVIVAEESPAYERHAAAELADFLGQVTGGQFEVEGSGFRGQSSRLLVGAKAAKLADKDFSLKNAKPETVIIRTVGNDLIIAGEGTRGTLYAVYTFLGDVVGCRWWTSTESTIPRKKTLKVSQQDYEYSPQ